MQQPQFTLKACSEAELAEFNKGLTDLLTDLNLELRVQPQFVMEQNTNKFLVDAQVVVYKKVEMQLVEKNDHPKEQGPNEDGPINEDVKAEEPSQEAESSSTEGQA